MDELILVMQEIKDILLTINSNIETLNSNVESLASGGVYSISDVCDKLDTISSTENVGATVSSIDSSVTGIEMSMP